MICLKFLKRVDGRQMKGIVSCHVLYCVRYSALFNRRRNLCATKNVRKMSTREIWPMKEMVLNFSYVIK